MLSFKALYQSRKCLRFDLPSEEFSVSVEFIVVFIVIFKSVLLDVSNKLICFLSPTPRTDKKSNLLFNTLRIWNKIAHIA